MARPTEIIRARVLDLLDKFTQVEQVQVAAAILSRVGLDRATCKVLTASLDAPSEEALFEFFYDRFLD